MSPGEGGLPYTAGMRSARRLAVVIAASLVAVSCGGGTPSAAEYADTIEDMVREMNRGLDELQVVHDANPITVESERSFWDRRVALRDTFLEGIRDLVPPPEYAAMHTAALDVISRLVVAEHGVRDEVDRAEDVGDLIAISNGPAMDVLTAADEEAIALCRSAEATLDTSSDEGLDPGIPWITPAVGEVVRVVFGCTSEERSED